MSPADQLERAENLLGEAALAIEAALPGVPAYSVDAVRFARAELAVVRRRLGNLHRLLSTGKLARTSTPLDPPEAAP